MMGGSWRFYQLVDDAGVGVVDRWLKAEGVKVEAKFDQRMRHLMRMPVSDWIENWAKQLRGECDGLVEIRLKARNVQHRPLGFFGPNKGEFTIVLCAKEKNDRFIPKDACEIARRLRNEIKAGKRFTCALKIE